MDDNGWVVFYEHGTYMGYATCERYVLYALTLTHPSWKNRVDRGAATQKLHDPGKEIPSEADHPFLSGPIASVAPSSNAPCPRREPRQPTTGQRDGRWTTRTTQRRWRMDGHGRDGNEAMHRRIHAVSTRHLPYSGALVVLVASARDCEYEYASYYCRITSSGNVHRKRRCLSPILSALTAECCRVRFVALYRNCLFWWG